MSVISILWRSVPACLQTALAALSCACAQRLQTREADQVSTQTEARTLARRQADAGGQQVQQGERDRGNDGHRQDLLQVQLLLGDDEGRQRHGQTLQEILDRARHELSDSEAVHLIPWVAKFHGRVRLFSSG